MDVSISRFQMGVEQLPPASAGIPHDGKQLWKHAAVSIKDFSSEVGAMSGTPFEAGISSELGVADTSSDCIASFQPQQGSDNPFRDSVQGYRSSGWGKMRAGVGRLLLTRRLARATTQLLKQVQEPKLDESNGDSGERRSRDSREFPRCSDVKQSSQSEPALARPAAHTVSGEELMHLAADMKRSSAANKTAKPRFAAFALSRQSLSGRTKHYSSDEDDPRQHKKGAIKFRITGGRGKSFTSIAKSMFAKNRKKNPILVDVDVEPLLAMPEPHEQGGCILNPPLPPSERQLAAGTYSDDSERGSVDRPCLLEPGESLFSHSSHVETLMTSLSSMDCNKGDTAQQLYNEIQAAYEQEHGHGVEQVEFVSGTAKECYGVVHAPPTTLSELESLLQATQQRNILDWELERLVAGVLRELSVVTSKVLPSCLPHLGNNAAKVSQELRGLEALLMQRAKESEGSSGRSDPAPAVPHAQHADPGGPNSHSPDFPLRTFSTQALHAPPLAGSCSEDGDVSFLTQPPSLAARMRHHAEGTPDDDAPLPHPPFKLLTPVQWLQQSWKETGSSSVRPDRTRTLSHVLSHTISSCGSSVDGGQGKGAGGQAAKASQNSGSLDVVGTVPEAVCTSRELVHGVSNGSCPAPCIRRGSVDELKSDAYKVAHGSAFFQHYHPSQHDTAGTGGACMTSPEGQLNSTAARQPCATLDVRGAAWKSAGEDAIDTLDADLTQASSPLHVYTGTFTSTGDFVLDDDS